METLRFNYPEDYYSFEDGVNLNDHEINKFVDKIVKKFRKKIKKGKKSNYHYIATGNVFVCGFLNREENDKYTIEIIVTKNYSSATECNIK